MVLRVFSQNNLFMLTVIMGKHCMTTICHRCITTLRQHWPSIGIFISVIQCFYSARTTNLPTDCIKPAIVPIIKNKTGDTSDKNNYGQMPWSLPHLNYLKCVYWKFYKCTLLHIITSLDLKQNTLLTCVGLL